MKNIFILIIEILLTVTLVALGLSGRRFLFIEGSRAATITLGIIGMAFCSIGIMKFGALAPAHPLSILGYFLGSIALLTLLTQIFHWDILLIRDADTALIVLGVVILFKSIIGRFSYVLPQ